MTNYAVKAAETKIFTVNQDDAVIGRLIYESWFSFRSTIELDDDSTFTVVPKGFWGTTIDVKKEGDVILDFRMNWNGQIVLSQKTGYADQSFLFKQTSLFKSTLALLDDKQEKLLVIEPDFSLTKLTYNYQLTASESFERLADKKLLLLVAVHCANYYMSMVMASVAAAG